MAEYSGPVDAVRSLCPGRDTWKIRVRVIRTWEMCPIDDPSSPYSMQMVLIDAEGHKIEASVRKTLIPKFKCQIIEGKVYKIIYFIVAANGGGYRASSHESKIVFNGRTRIVPEECDIIPRNQFSLMSSADILKTGGESDYLVDIVGLVTNVIPEKQYSKGGKVSRMIELELTDDKGKIQCAFFGNYVDVVKRCIENSGPQLPVALIQFAKVKTFKGNAVVQNVMNATNLFWNADDDFSEVVSFRNGLPLPGIDVDTPLMRNLESLEYHSSSIADEFLRQFPRKTVNELNVTSEDGTFIVLAQISSFVDGEKWWYPSCRCHKSVTIEDGLYFCGSCSTFVLGVTPRYRVKIEVSDGEDLASFVVFDAEFQNMIQKECKEFVLCYKSVACETFPEEFQALIGRQMLFKVQKTVDYGAKFDDSFKVKKICNDASVIESFKDNEKVLTPQKLIKPAIFADLPSGITESSPTLSSCLSEITPSVIGLEDISFDEDVGYASSTKSVGSAGSGASTSNPAKRRRLSVVKKEK